MLLSAGSGWIYYNQQSIGQTISIIGDVSNPYEFPAKDQAASEVKVKAEINGVSRNYTGYLISDIIDLAQPIDKEGVLQVTATDGYSFFIPLQEVFSNPNLILSQQESGEKSTFNIVGANSSKAWIRGVREIKVTRINGLEIEGSVLNPFFFNPLEWISEMDSTLFIINGEPKKLQGVPLMKIWEKSQPEIKTSVIIFSPGENSSDMEKSQFLGDDSIRLFVNLTPEGTRYLVGTMTGEILFDNVASIEIK